MTQAGDVYLGGKKVDVNWRAQWIWSDGPGEVRNSYLCARRDFEISGAPESEYRLHVSADARYRLYLNGEWLGDGPARSFYWAQQFDTYDVSGLLRAGRNTLAAFMAHYGEGNFQYDPSGQPGLLIQLEDNTGKPVVVTDGDWSVCAHAGYLPATMRISCQMPFEELVDARAFPADWMLPEGKLPNAQRARVLGPVGSGPWKTLVGRSVPMNSRDPVTAVSFFRTGAAAPPNFFMGFAQRPYLAPGYVMQNHKHLPGFAATIIDSPIEQKVTLFTLSDRFEEPIINGQIARDGEPIALRKGYNLCVVPFKLGEHHEYDRGYPGYVEQPVRLRGAFHPDAEWSMVGPIPNYADVRERIVAARETRDLEAFRDLAKPVSKEHAFPHGSAWMDSTVARVTGEALRIEHPEALFNSGADVCTIHPPASNCAELFLDFGRELIGYTEFDIDAPAGTVLTFNFLEEIEDGKRIHYSYGNLNALRYISSAGRQRFTSFLRRGFRYCRLIVSEMSGPVRFRQMRTLWSAHPSVENGSFECSDPLLNEIWRVGRHTLRCCSEDTFTDCPTYEQTYWVGDGRNEALVNYAAFGDIPLTRRCSELPALSLHRQLIPESQVPSAWDNLLPAWSLLWVQMAEEHYWYSGDLDYLAGIYPAVRKTLLNIRDHLLDSRGLFSIQAWNLFDWAGQDYGHKVVTHNQMFLIEALLRALRMADTLGRESERAEFSRFRDAMIEAVNAHLWDEARGAYIDSIHDDGSLSQVVSQQTNSLALSYGVAPADRAARIQNVTTNPPEGMVKVGSPFALFFILEAIIKQGGFEQALAIVRDRWGSMLKHGATTFWETFPGWDPKWWTRSYCHAWSAAPTYFLSRHQLGVGWSEPGFKSAVIAPRPCDLAWASGKVPTPQGSIHVAWERAEERFQIRVALPPGVEAMIVPPVAPDLYSLDVGATREKSCWLVSVPAGESVVVTATRIK